MVEECESLTPAGSPANTSEPRRWTPIRTALFLTVGLRIFYCAVAASFAPFLTLDRSLIARSYTENLIQRDTHPWIYALGGVWQRFDTLFYVHIARNGYDMVKSTVFFPLYPALIRVFSVLTQSELAAALLISTVATFFLFWGTLQLLELDYTPRTALRALTLWVVWPDAFTFFIGYPDSMLLALTIWSIYFARTSKWSSSGLAALFAGTTKALGCFTALPLLYIGWKQRDRRSLIAVLAAFSGTVAYQVWLHRSGCPPPSAIYENYWSTLTAAPWTTPIRAVHSLMQQWDALLFLNFAAITAVAIFTLTSRIPLEYRIYSLAAVLLFLTKSTNSIFESNIRYSLCVFAAYPAMAQRIKGNLGFVATAGFLMCLNLLLFRAYLDWSLVI